MKNLLRALFFAFFPVFLLVSPASALSPEEVLVIANMNAASSKGLALFYMERRKIPKENLLLLRLTDQETCTREEYDEKVLPPVRRFLKEHPDIRAIVTLYGVPLRVLGPERSDQEKQRIETLKKVKESLKAKLKQTRNLSADAQAELKRKIKRADKAYTYSIRNLDRTASFDSELSLVKKKEYNLDRWQPNPFYLGFKNQTLKIGKSDVMMTSRLDGASPKVVKRIINDSLEAEKEGLEGTAYFDARWKYPGDNKKVSGYAFYDKSIHEAARYHEKKQILPVKLNDSQDLFQPGDCPNAALYCGWYKLANYVDAFTWAKGSVGFHIASSECVTLRNKNSKVWCKKMLDKGIAATVGPVGEPYVQSFPVPELFFKLLTEGYLTLTESYFVSLPYLSWKMVLVGDPLYRLNLKKNHGGGNAPDSNSG
ncbi:TIGR03790 family protein [Desulfospira joergensenii]|uniref:TIGR03790 family protein n=1 Tax=Desulfospira joergensenii TaxID=53329 RepID=UPI0003B6EEF6|nr:TIGR03790 family protein [Desulfospira joergensenii]